MSAVLGPIHTWLFNKIKFQDQLTTAILKGVQEKGICQSLEQRLDEQYGALPTGQLEEIIDEGNIHGWLQTQVSLVEIRLADAVTTILKEEPSAASLILGIAYDYGKAHCIASDTTAKEALELLERCLLNGMPCDHVNQIIEDTEEKVSWQQTVDIHEAYWAKVQGDVRHYYDIREALIKGMMHGSKITFYRLNDQKYVLC